MSGNGEIPAERAEAADQRPIGASAFQFFVLMVSIPVLGVGHGVDSKPLAMFGLGMQAATLAAVVFDTDLAPALRLGFTAWVRRQKLLIAGICFVAGVAALLLGG